MSVNLSNAEYPIQISVMESLYNLFNSIEVSDMIHQQPVINFTVKTVSLAAEIAGV